MRRKAGDYGSVRVLLALGLFGVTLSGLLIAVHMALVGQLVAGLAVLPLTFAVYLRLLGSDFGSGGNGGGGWGPGGGEPAPPRPRTPGGGVDWDRFEREFWAHVDGRTLVG